MTDGVMGSRHNGNNNLIKIKNKRNLQNCLPMVSEVGWQLEEWWLDFRSAFN